VSAIASSLLTTIILFAITGCGGDDKGTNPEPNPTPTGSLIATWKVTSNKIAGQEVPSELSSVGETYIFNADSTGIWKSKDAALSTDFTFSTENDSLTITMGITYTSFWYNVTKTTLTLRQKQAFTGFVIEFGLAKQ
jgi:hypothetical protein